MAFWKRSGGKKSGLSSVVAPTSSSTSTRPPKPIQVLTSPCVSPDRDLGDGDAYYQCNLYEKSILTTRNQEEKNRVDLIDLGDLSAWETIRSWSRRSRLTKNLRETLQDLTALNYFQHYLESEQASTYLNLLNDIKNYQLLAATVLSGVTAQATSANLSSPSVIGLPEARCSPTRGNDQKHSRLLNSTSSSSGFSDDTSIDSPSHCRVSFTCKSKENETMLHNLMSERRRIIHKYLNPESSDFLSSITSTVRDCEWPPTTEFKDSLWDCFEEVQVEVYSILEEEYFFKYLHSEFHYRHQLEIINSGKLGITDILYNDTCLFYFMEYMDQYAKRHWLEFWLAADNYRSQWNVMNARLDALTIYNKYFSLQATQPLGLGDAVRLAIEENICSTDSGPGPECFENAVNVVLCAMEKECLSTFCSSPIFAQYVKEISGALKNSASRNKRSGSTSTINSETSCVSACTSSSALGHSINHPIGVSSNNLAPHNFLPSNTTETNMVRLINNISNESLIIDLRQLNDPNALWQRKKIALSLGWLSPFGRFHSEIEPVPDKKTGSVFSKAVRKFVLAEDQEREEAAWYAAEIIVKDVMAIALLKNSLETSSTIPTVIAALNS